VLLRVLREDLRRDPRRLPQPQVLIDGMSPSDSKARSGKIKAELELVRRYNGLKFHAWHPLYSLNLSSEEKLKLLEQCEEFKPVIDLYMEFGDGLNCIVYPYKSVAKCCNTTLSRTCRLYTTL
jgi:hypothetical protein